jgi:hypothetical protein
MRALTYSHMYLIACLRVYQYSYYHHHYYVTTVRACVCICVSNHMCGCMMMVIMFMCICSISPDVLVLHLDTLHHSAMHVAHCLCLCVCVCLFMSPPLHPHLLFIYNILSLYIHDYVSLHRYLVCSSPMCVTIIWTRASPSSSEGIWKVTRASLTP